MGLAGDPANAPAPRLVEGLRLKCHQGRVSHTAIGMFEVRNPNCLMMMIRLIGIFDEFWEPIIREMIKPGF